MFLVRWLGTEPSNSRGIFTFSTVPLDPAPRHFHRLLLLHEQPTLAGVSGILITTLGLLVLLQPDLLSTELKIKAVVLRKGVVYGIIGAILFSFSFPLDKITISKPSGLVLAAGMSTAVGLTTLLYSLVTSSGQRANPHLLIKEKTLIFLIITIFAGTVLVSQALLYAPVANAASVKRLWSLWAVILGGKFLHESHIKEKIIATVIMALGIFLLSV